MAQNITLLGASYTGVPAVVLPKTGGGTASFVDVSDTTAAASDVVNGRIIYNSNGVQTTGTLVIQHYYTGNSAPSSSLGENGDIYLEVAT